MTTFDVDKLKADFVTHFSDIPIEIPYDRKHKQITSQIYSSSDWANKITNENVRHWECQTDQGAPPNVRYLIAFYGLYLGVTKYLYKRIFQRQINRELMLSLKDDFKVIKEISGNKILCDNKIQDTFGKTQTCKVHGVRVNVRWMRYIYLATQIINKNLLTGQKIWVDIGPFYGGLQQILFKYFPDGKIVLVDFQHQLLRSYLYLNYSYPNSPHHLNPKISEKFDSPGFYYIHPSKLFDYNALSPDLLTSFFSIGELRKEIALEYFNSKLWNQSKIIYLVNRFVSSPFFEKTYDSNLTILDYIRNTNKKVKYLDIFPIATFLRVKRKIFNSKRFRNLSSNYFELILSSN